MACPYMELLGLLTKCCSSTVDWDSDFVLIEWNGMSLAPINNTTQILAYYGMVDLDSDFVCAVTVWNGTHTHTHTHTHS